jgi:conjugative transfer region lipoprotein (TIGR03751 family)
MNYLTRTRLTLIALISVLSFAGCATPGKGTLPQGGDMTMAAIYKQETGTVSNEETDENYRDLSLEKARDQVIDEHNTTVYAGYTATSVNQIHTLFKKLNNPEILLYVYPHLVAQNEEEIPVPGYTTAFFLYQKNQFALPDERF